MKATFSRDKFWRDGMEELQAFPALMARKLFSFLNPTISIARAV